MPGEAKDVGAMFGEKINVVGAAVGAAEGGDACRGLGGCAPRADMVDGVDDVAVGEVGDDVAGDSVGSGVVVDSAKETGGPRVVDDVVGEVADVEVVGKTNGETAGCIVGSAVGA